MNVLHMREMIRNAPKYNYTLKAAATWNAKVDKMSDKQVIAIYYRMLHAGELKFRVPKV